MFPSSTKIERRRAIVAAVQRLGEAGIGVDDLAVRRPTLDDVFLALTGHGAEQPAAAADAPAEPSAVIS